MELKRPCDANVRYAYAKTNLDRAREEVKQSKKGIAIVGGLLGLLNFVGIKTLVTRCRLHERKVMKKEAMRDEYYKAATAALTNPEVNE